MPPESMSVRAQSLDPAPLASVARYCAEELLEQLIRFNYQPERYTDEAVRKRAIQDVDGDLAADLRLGFIHTPEEAAAYTTIYVDAFLAAFRDAALVESIRARFRNRERGCFIVCFR